jgi:hypothetical protein
MRSNLRRLATTIAIGSAVAAALLAGPIPARAGSITFGTPTASSTFGKGIVFNQPYSGGLGITEVDIVIQYQGVFGVSVARVEKVGPSSFSYTVDTSTGQLQSNTRLKAYFEVTFSDGSTQDGPDVSVTYLDDRFDWHTLTGKVVVLHWYEGTDAFAQQALKMGEDGIANADDFLGYTETAPIDFYVYADQQAFYDALGPGTRENVGGQANTQTRTLFALVAPDELGYAASVVPHELTHVVFDDVTSNPYHYPPHWLNEGVAVYVSQGFDSSDRSRVSQAVADGTLMPLAAIRGQFPTTQTQFYLAYAESVSAVDFFVRTYGHASLVKLLKTFGTGASDDEAFTAAIGIGVDGFDKAWQASVGQTAMRSFGPQPAPTGPLPPGWTASGVTGAEPRSSAGQAGTAPAAGANPSTADGSGSGPGEASLAVGGTGLLGLGALIVLERRRRKRKPAA